MELYNVLIAYLIIGAVMYGGGAIAFEDAGVATYLLDDPDTINQSVSDDLESAQGPIQQAAGAIGGGGLLAVWGLISNLFGYIYWPITVLMGVGAPGSVVVMLGGSLSLGFTVGVINLISKVI